MLIKLNQESEICKSYSLATPVPYAEREIPNDILHLIEKQKVVPRAQGKRKITTPTATSSPKPKRAKKQRSKPILRDEDSKTESDPNIRKVHKPSPHNSPISEPF